MIKTLLRTQKAMVICAPLALATLFSSCSNDTKAPETTADVAAADTAAPAPEQSSKQDEFFQALPNPIHLARVFNRSGLRYVAGLTNPAGQSTQYQSSSARALNLGVYTTDLAYSTFNNQSQSAVTYFKAVQTLGDGLNMTSMFQQTNLVPRFEKNLGNKDSLLHLMSQLSLESDMLLRQASRLDVVYLSFAGAWTESMYLASNMAAQNKTLEIYNSVLDQQNSLAKLILLLEDFQENTELAGTIGGLKDIQAKLEKLKASGGDVNSPDFGDLTSTIKTFRDKIIKEV